jgi:hypothetical protein
MSVTPSTSPSPTPRQRRRPGKMSEEGNFIPLRKAELRQRLLDDPILAPPQREQLEQLCRLLEAAIHYDYCQLLEQLKDSYAPFDPDADTKRVTQLPAAQRDQRADDFFDAFIDLVDRGNFQHVPHEQLTAALDKASALGLNLVVNFSVFQRLEIFARGHAIVKKQLPRTWTRWTTRTVEVPVFQRLILVFRLKQHARVGKEISADTIYAKLFKDIPKHDLEMLLPGTEVRMSWLDHGKIVLPTLSGVGLAVHKIVTGAALLAISSVAGTLALLGLIGGTVGYGARSFFAYLNTKDKYQLSLTRSLYFQNLDNNAGVMYRLLDDAEEQEFREAMLAYFLLWKNAGPDGWTIEQLDLAAEDWLLHACAVQVDFEIADALNKLVAMKLIRPATGARWRAVELDEALATLDATWDGIFHSDPLRNRTQIPHFFRPSERPSDEDWGPVL